MFDDGCEKHDLICNERITMNSREKTRGRLFPHIVYFVHDKRWKNVVTKSYLYRNVFGDRHTTTVEVYYMTDSHVIVVETVRSVDTAVPSIIL